MSVFSTPRLLYCIALLISTLVLTSFWYWQGRSLNLADVATPTHLLDCVSYSPFDKDQSPLQKSFVLRSERIDADLALLARYFRCIRTYSSSGLEEIPSLARKHGLQLIQGAWVSSNPIETQKEIATLIASAKQNPDVVRAVIVGNETLLRKEVTSAELVTLIHQVKTHVAQPVTYADVWEFWKRHPDVAPAVDFLTIHLLPYWEDQPLDIPEALAHVTKVREEFGRTFAPKKILIGETGWPSAGRQRETAVPSRINQAQFIRGFISIAEEKGWEYNLIEAFDQPWKRINEGAVGGYWGLFDAARQDKNILSGAVSNLPNWSLWLSSSLVLMALLLWLAGSPRTTQASLVVPTLAGLGSACLMLWVQWGLVNNRFFGEWLLSLLLFLLNAIVLLHALLSQQTQHHWRHSIWTWLAARTQQWMLATGFFAAVLMLGLVFEPRYRSFPSSALILPALLYCWQPVRGNARELYFLAALIGLGIPLQLYQEGLESLQALGWSVVCVVLVLALVRAARQSGAVNFSTSS